MILTASTQTAMVWAASPKHVRHLILLAALAVVVVIAHPVVAHADPVAQAAATAGAAATSTSRSNLGARALIHDLFQRPSAPTARVGDAMLSVFGSSD